MARTLEIDGSLVGLDLGQAVSNGQFVTNGGHVLGDVALWTSQATGHIIMCSVSPMRRGAAARSACARTCVIVGESAGMPTTVCGGSAKKREPSGVRSNAARGTRRAARNMLVMDAI